MMKDIKWRYFLPGILLAVGAILVMMINSLTLNSSYVHIGSTILPIIIIGPIYVYYAEKYPEDLGYKNTTIFCIILYLLIAIASYLFAV